MEAPMQLSLFGFFQVWIACDTESNQHFLSLDYGYSVPVAFNLIGVKSPDVLVVP